MADGNPNRFEKSLGLWVIIAAIVGLNLWYDYHHPLWLLLDAIIAIALIAHWLCRPQNTPGNPDDPKPGD